MCPWKKEGRITFVQQKIAACPTPRAEGFMVISPELPINIVYVRVFFFGFSILAERNLLSLWYALLSSFVLSVLHFERLVFYG